MLQDHAKRKTKKRTKTHRHTLTSSSASGNAVDPSCLEQAWSPLLVIPWVALGVDDRLLWLQGVQALQNRIGTGTACCGSRSPWQQQHQENQQQGRSHNSSSDHSTRKNLPSTRQIAVDMRQQREMQRITVPSTMATTQTKQTYHIGQFVFDQLAVLGADAGN